MAKEKSSVRKFKEIMLDMFRGYPNYTYFGILEKEYGKENIQQILETLEKDGLIEIGQLKKDDKIFKPAYRLQINGINFAISMIQLDYAEKMQNLTSSMKFYTGAVVYLTVVIALLTAIQALNSY